MASLASLKLSLFTSHAGLHRYPLEEENTPIQASFLVYPLLLRLYIFVQDTAAYTAPVSTWVSFVNMSTQAQTSTGINLNGANQDPSAAPSATPAISAVPVGTSATVTSTTPSNQDSLGVGSNLGVNSPTANPTPGAGASTGGTKGGTNAGIIAGAAVGAAIGAAILTFLITFMFLKKKNHKERRHGKRRDESGGISTYSEKALPKDLSRHDEAALAASAWQKHLPQSADDNTIRSAVKTLFDQVELHVENFYRDMAVPMTEELQSELQRVDSPHLSESIVALLPRARSQTALIKHCLLSYIVASISIDDNSVQSLLPSDYATLPQLARAPGQKKPGKHSTPPSPIHTLSPTP